MDNEQLVQIDQGISQQLKKLSLLAESMTLTEVALFELSDLTDVIAEEAHHYPGIYLFEIRADLSIKSCGDWLDEFTELWLNHEEPIAWVPGIKQIRIKAHKRAGSLSEWVPLYIGKSRNVGKRISEHIHKGREKTTFAMKLKIRRIFYGQSFRVKTLQLNIENYDVIAPHLESFFREKWHPLVGKQ